MPFPNETPTTLSLAEAKQLLEYAEQGRLYEIAAWIRAGNSLQVPAECKTTPLRIAIDRGFHSLVVLLARNDVGQRAKDDALWRAVTRGNLELIELLLNHGAELSSIPFSEVLLNWKPSVIQFFLVHGADIVTDAPFTRAFVARIRTALRPYLDCKRNHPELAAELQKQADAALRHFCSEGNEKWISLMLWLGADPRTEGPTPGDPAEPEYYTTALRQVGYKANFKILKLLKLRPDTDNLAELVHDAAMFGRADAVSYLLQLGAKLNDKANGGSSALDGSLWNLGLDHVSPFCHHRHRPLYEVRPGLDIIQKLCQHGALWRPSDTNAMNSLRRSLFACEPAVTTELLKIFRKYQACSEETVEKLLHTPRMQQHLSPVADRLPRRRERSPSRHGEPSGKTSPGRQKSVRIPHPTVELLRKYDRNVLYDEVWAQPMWTLANKYGISDVGLAKTCRKLGVPLPGLGYWAKKSAGKKVPKRPPLPVLSMDHSSY